MRSSSNRRRPHYGTDSRRYRPRREEGEAAWNCFSFGELLKWPAPTPPIPPARGWPNYETQSAYRLRLILFPFSRLQLCQKVIPALIADAGDATGWRFDVMGLMRLDRVHALRRASFNSTWRLPAPIRL
jgi:hypothetical protein